MENIAKLLFCLGIAMAYVANYVLVVVPLTAAVYFLLTGRFILGE